MNSTLQITILVNNKASSNLEPEHGFSAWIEAFGNNILFDTGQGQALTCNAQLLGISLEKTDHLVLSHGHYDHGGGIARVMQSAHSSIIHLHPEAVIPRYSVSPTGGCRSIGLPRKVIRFLSMLADNRLQWTPRARLIEPSIGLTGPIPATNYFEVPQDCFYTDPEGKSEDLIPDDQALWINTDKGLIICVGCAHAGIINTIRHVIDITGQNSIRAVIGGFHLNRTEASSLYITVDQLASFRPDLIAPCHCTGEYACSLIREKLGKAYLECLAGERIVFE